MKIAYIISKIDYFVSYEWIADKINLHKNQLCFVFLNKDKCVLQKRLEKKGFLCKHIYFEENKLLYPKIIFSFTTVR